MLFFRGGGGVGGDWGVSVGGGGEGVGAQSNSPIHRNAIYSQISMALTALGPCKFVRDMGSSSH